MYFSFRPAIIASFFDEEDEKTYIIRRRLTHKRREKPGQKRGRSRLFGRHKLEGRISKEVGKEEECRDSKEAVAANVTEGKMG